MAEKFEDDPGYEFLGISREDKIAFTSKPFDSVSPQLSGRF
jgi:hypothetical protein